MMKRLLTFVPKNLEKRAKDLEIIKAKELADYDNFMTSFQKNLTAMKGVISNDPKEQLFIDLMEDCHIKADQDKHPFYIIISKGTEYVFQYNWKNGYFYCSFNRVWSVFKPRFQMSYKDWQQFITDQVERHFKFQTFCHVF